MSLKRLIPFFFTALILSVALLSSCSQSDNALFNEADAQYITLNAYMSKNVDTGTVKIKSDTIHPGDSLILLTTVYPSKSIRSKDYYWAIDGEIFSKEYNCKKTITTPGRHKISFVFKDYFGDSLSDIISLFVGSAPELNDTAFIPANGTQYIPSNEIINFAWNANDPDSLWDLRHHFVLMEAKGIYPQPRILVDTILHKAQFTYYNGFSPLTQYEWTVSIENELTQKSEKSIHATFSTNGIKDESAIVGFISNSSTNKNILYHLLLTDSNGKTVFEDKNFSSARENAFFIKNLHKGSYTLISSVDDKPDFSPDTTKFKINAGKILTLDSILLQDILPPQIKSIYESDTVIYADTLKFIIKDFGGEILSNRIKASLEGENILGFRLQNDTLYISLPELRNSWTFRPLSITAYDQSNNLATKEFLIAPAKTLPEVLSE